MKTEKTTTETARIKRLDPDLKIRMETFNVLAQKTRELLNTEIEKPFELDPVLTLDMDLDEPIRLNEFLSRELFNSNSVQIIHVKIKDSVIEFILKDSNGNYGHERVYLGERVKTIRFWEYVLIALVSWFMSDYVLDKKEKIAILIDDLKDVLDSVLNSVKD